MSEISIMFDENGIAKEYDDTFDITIHCESEEEQNKVLEILNRRWIPVSERLPEEHKTIIDTDVFDDPSEEVLVQMKSGYMKVSRYWGSRERYKDRPWIDLSYPTTDEVIAWMPLPEPYKAESENKDG